jgi:hypothetical protein
MHETHTEEYQLFYSSHTMIMRNTGENEDIDVDLAQSRKIPRQKRSNDNNYGENTIFSEVRNGKRQHRTPLRDYSARR